MQQECIANHSGQVTAVDTDVGEISDGSQSRSHREPVYQGPVVVPHCSPVDANVVPSGLTAHGGRERQHIGVQISEGVDDGSGTVRNDLGGTGGNALSGGAAGVETDPGCSKIVVRTGRGAREAVDAVGEALQLSDGG